LCKLTAVYQLKRLP